MGTIWAIPIIASILILGLIGYSQDASAFEVTVSDQVSCESIGGTWNAPRTCTIDSGMDDDDILVIPSGIVLEISTTFLGIGYEGTINNFGTIAVFNIFEHFGTINNFGTLANYAIFLHSGTIYNSGNLLTATISDFNNPPATLFVNSDVFGGTINNDCTGVIIDVSTIVGAAISGTPNPPIDICSDGDGDGFSSPVDCDDTNATVFPGAPELLDGLDNDCNGDIDDNPISELMCGAGTTLNMGTNKCDPNLNSICGQGTFISGLECLGLGLQAVGGIFVEISTLAVIAAAVGVDPLITGLVVITMLGITGQAAWFIHRRKKKSNL